MVDLRHQVFPLEAVAIIPVVAGAMPVLVVIARVLRPGASALVWDFRPGFVPFHGDLPDPIEHTRGTPLRVVSATPWRWPWRLELTQRIELARAGE